MLLAGRAFRFIVTTAAIFAIVHFWAETSEIEKQNLLRRKNDDLPLLSFIARMLIVLPSLLVCGGYTGFAFRYTGFAFREVFLAFVDRRRIGIALLIVTFFALSFLTSDFEAWIAASLGCVMMIMLMFLYDLCCTVLLRSNAMLEEVPIDEAGAVAEQYLLALDPNQFYDAPNYSDDTCGICLEQVLLAQGSRATSCGHVFHEACLKNHILHSVRQHRDVTCCICRHPMSKCELPPDSPA